MIFELLFPLLQYLQSYIFVQLWLEWVYISALQQQTLSVKLPCVVGAVLICSFSLHEFYFFSCYKKKNLQHISINIKFLIWKLVGNFSRNFSFQKFCFCRRWIFYYLPQFIKLLSENFFHVRIFQRYFKCELVIFPNHKSSCRFRL